MSSKLSALWHAILRGATKAEISGRTDTPEVSIVETVAGLVQNAFFKAILPSFDLEISRAGRAARRSDQ